MDLELELSRLREEILEVENELHRLQGTKSGLGALHTQIITLCTSADVAPKKDAIEAALEETRATLTTLLSDMDKTLRT